MSSNTTDVLRALLDTELIPKKDVYMKRFGVNFRIKALTDPEIKSLRDQASSPKKGGGETIDSEKLNGLFIAAACISPNWSDPALLEKFGPTPADAVRKRLLGGEIARLASEILDLSGFGDENEAIDEIKN